MIGEPAWGEGQRGRGVDPLPEIDIDEVDADGGGPDTDLPFLGVPELHLLPPHHLGAAELMDPDGLGLHHDAVAGAAEAEATGGGRGWTGAGGRGHCEGRQLRMVEEEEDAWLPPGGAKKPNKWWCGLSSSRNLDSGHSLSCYFLVNVFVRSEIEMNNSIWEQLWSREFYTSEVPRRTDASVWEYVTDEETCSFVVLSANLISNSNCFVDEIVSKGMPGTVS